MLHHQATHPSTQKFKNMITKSSPSVNYSFTCKKRVTGPFKTFIRFFKFKKPIFKRRSTSKPTTTKHRFRCLTSIFRSSKKAKKDMDRVMELKSFSDAGGYMQKAPCSSPLTPAYVKMARAVNVEEDKDVGEACRSFENYLVKMIAEEGKMRDLVDVEELLYCWNNLKSPVFMKLVCRFYGELCKDLFSTNDGDDDDDIHNLIT